MFVHKHCGGFVSSWGHCEKCGKRWNPIGFWLNPNIAKQVQAAHLTKEEVAKKLAERHKKTTYAGWADRLPGVGAVASALPNWPRWVRILVLLVLIAGIALLIVLV